MSDSVKILLVGAGGYGHIYVNALLDDAADYPIELAGVIEPAHTSPSYLRMKDAGVPEYESMEDFYSRNTADLCIISTPIGLHKKHVIYALEHGSNVLCEKPAAGCAADVTEMVGAQKKSGKFVAVGFQLSYAEPILNLKRDIHSGVWGKPLMLKSLTMFPRTRQYFNGRSWAGKKYAADGTAIMDSIANNAAAHCLHNMFFLLGDKIDTADIPLSCECRLYRANDIETFDAVAAKFKTASGVDMLYYAAHPIEHSFGPAFELICEKGTVVYGEKDKNVVGVFTDGSVKDYGCAGGHTSKLFCVLDTILGRGNKIYCNIETALSHAKAVEMFSEKLLTGDVKIFDESELESIELKGESAVMVPGLEEKFRRGFESGVFVE